ncbi:MAG: GLUG motif-containing protein, partial [Cellulosilyticaceae bacterium]
MKRNNWIALLLVVVMSFSVLALGITLSGQEQTLAISTEKELVAFSKKCKRDSWSKGKYVVLKADLDLSEIDFSPIPIFAGTFDGGGHTISGLKVKAKGSAQGLFRYVEEGAVIKNLKVEGKIVPGGEQKYIGGIAGSNKGTLQQCEFTGTVEGDRTVGGLVGINEATGKLIECHVSGTLQGKQALGGIAGENKGTIVACTSSAQVNTRMVDTKALDVSNLMARDLEETDVETLEQKSDASDIQDIGGIVGINTGIVQDCTNSGRIGYEHVGYNVGGIAGRQSGYITGCINTGVVSGRKEVGGIVGQMEPYVVLKFSQSKLHQLSQELDTLQSLIQQATQSGDAGSDAISDQLSTVQDHV